MTKGVENSDGRRPRLTFLFCISLDFSSSIDWDLNGASPQVQFYFHVCICRFFCYFLATGVVCDMSLLCSLSLSFSLSFSLSLSLPIQFSLSAGELCFIFSTFGQ